MSTEHEIEPPWKADETGSIFKEHFDIGYEDFMKLICLFEESHPEKFAKFEKIRNTHEEAAILWAIHEGKSHGLLHEL